MCFHLNKVRCLVIQGQLKEAVQFTEVFVKRFRGVTLSQESGQYICRQVEKVIDKIFFNAEDGNATESTNMGSGTVRIEAGSATPKDPVPGPTGSTNHCHTSCRHLGKTELSPSIVAAAKKQMEELKQTMAQHSKKVSKEELARNLTQKALKTFMRSLIEAKNKNKEEVGSDQPELEVFSNIEDNLEDIDTNWRGLIHVRGKKNINPKALYSDGMIQRRKDIAHLGRELKKLDGSYRHRRALFYKKAKKFTGYSKSMVDYLIKYADLVQQGEWLVQYPTVLQNITQQIPSAQIAAINQDQSLKEQMEKGVVD